MDLPGIEEMDAPGCGARMAAATLLSVASTGLLRAESRWPAATAGMTPCSCTGSTAVAIGPSVTLAVVMWMASVAAAARPAGSAPRLGAGVALLAVVRVAADRPVCRSRPKKRP